MTVKETLAPLEASASKHGLSDPNVNVPDVIKRAAAAAEAAHKAAYGDAAPAPAPVVDAPQIPLAPAPAAPDAPITIVAADPPQVPDRAQTPPQTPAEPPKVPVQTPPAQAQEPAPPVTPQPDNWEHRYHAMKGRYDQSQMTIGSMQTQMQELGDELQRVHTLLAQRGPVPNSGPQTLPQPRNSLLSEEDRKAYGEELTDFVQKAAKDAIAPELTNLEQENLRLRQQINRNAQNTVYGELRKAIPNWEEVNNSPRFKAWVRLPDIYSGQSRVSLLKQAFQQHNAPRVIAFFNGFLDEERATGHLASPAAQPAPVPPRDPAVSLATLAAPGPARPAGGDTQVPDSKPIYTRQYIKGFYDQVRAGLWAGREADKARLENDIFAAQREGRVR